MERVAVRGHDSPASGRERRGVPSDGVAESLPTGSYQARLLELQELAGNRAVVQLLTLQREPTGGPTFGNLFPADKFDPKITTFKLEFRGGKWWEVRPPGSGKQLRLASGPYNYVVQGDVIHAHRSFGHVQLARGGRVTYAGDMHFSEPGTMASWTNDSGHTRAAKSFAKDDMLRLKRLGFDEAKFVPVGKGAAPGSQLPVWQPGTKPAPIPGAEKPSSGGAGGATATGAAEVKAAGAEAGAVSAGASAIGVEAKAENVLTKGARIAGVASRAARISQLVIALGMPGPQDVFFMFIAFFASIAEAKAKLRADAYATGFAQGLAAAVTWISPEDAKEMLMFKAIDPSMGERVAGFEGVRERGTNDGIVAGWKVGANFNADQRKGFRREALAAKGLKEKRRYTLDEYIAMGAALRPTVIELLAEAERQAREKEARAIIEVRQKAGVDGRPPM